MASAREMYEHACRQVTTPDPPLPWEALGAEHHWWYEQCWNYALESVAPDKNARILYLEGLINSPETQRFFRAVRLEAAHQVERWGADHDAGKGAADWFWLLGYLSGKALASFVKGDRAKGLHHIVSSAACLLNWHRNATGRSTKMRPGIEPPEGA